MRRAPILAVMLLTAACTSWRTGTSSTPEPKTIASSGSGELGDTPTTVTLTPEPTTGSTPVQRWLTHARQDFEHLGVVARDGNEPIGIACSDKGLSLMAALPSASAPPTGYFLTDAETAKLTQRANIVALARATAQACIPLVIGPEKFWAVIGMPKAIQDIIGGQ